MDDYPKIILASPGLTPERHSHPWIRAAALGTIDEKIPDGALVTLIAPRSGRPVAIGTLNRRSQWVVRILTRDARASIDLAWFQRRIGQAIDLRRRVAADASALRIVNSEADGLPGLIVDRYGPVLVVQCLTLGMEQLRPLWMEAIRSLFADSPTYERSDGAGRAREGLGARTGWIIGVSGGPPRLPLRVNEGTLLFELDPTSGQKTGMYLDQRVNRRLAAPLLACGRLLDAFTYQGGFALHALDAGARSACLVDVSADAINAARRNAEINGLADRCEFVAANAFDLLRDRAGGGQQYDGIVLDPPPFSRSRGAVDPAWRGYKEINLRALQLLAPGGTLVSCSCSHHFGRDLFSQMLDAAARDARVQLQVIHWLEAAPDHPTLIGMPESEYLVGVIARAWPWAARRRHGGRPAADVGVAEDAAPQKPAM